jgi:hypothetical protein
MTCLWNAWKLVVSSSASLSIFFRSSSWHSRPCRSSPSSPLSQSLLHTQRWLEENARDILDESDEILSPKYQLVYTIGTQHAPDGDSMRWKLVQEVFDLVRACACDERHKGSLSIDGSLHDSHKSESSHKSAVNIFSGKLQSASCLGSCSFIFFPTLLPRRPTDPLPVHHRTSYR